MSDLTKSTENSMSKTWIQKATRRLKRKDTVKAVKTEAKRSPRKRG